MFLRHFTQRPLRPLHLPIVFSVPATSGAHFPTRPSDRPSGQGVQPQRSVPAFQPGQRPNRQERHVERFVSRQNMATRGFSITPALPPVASMASHEQPRPSSAPSSQALQPATPPHSHPGDAPPPPELPPFLRGKIDLPHRTICHSQHAQQLMERLKIPWGVQFELARGVLAERWTWEHVTESVLQQLKGSNAQAAPKINAVMSGTAPRTGSSKTNLDLW